jgi:phage shock protein B
MLEEFAMVMVVFMVFVAPLWLILHYRTLNKKTAGLSVAEHEQLERLTQVAKQMAERMETLERILDEQDNDWRSHNETR